MPRRITRKEGPTIYSFSIPSSKKYLRELLNKKAQEGFSRSQIIIEALERYFEDELLNIRNIKSRFYEIWDKLDSALNEYEARGRIPEDIARLVEEGKVIVEKVRGDKSFPEEMRKYETIDLEMLIEKWEKILSKN